MERRSEAEEDGAKWEKRTTDGEGGDRGEGSQQMDSWKRRQSSSRGSDWEEAGESGGEEDFTIRTLRYSISTEML